MNKVQAEQDKWVATFYSCLSGPCHLKEQCLKRKKRSPVKSHPTPLTTCHDGFLLAMLTEPPAGCSPRVTWGCGQGFLHFLSSPVSSRPVLEKFLIVFSLWKTAFSSFQCKYGLSPICNNPLVFYLKIAFVYLFLERGKGKKKEREININTKEKQGSVDRNLTCNPGMCPDWEPNLPLCGMMPN